MSIDTLTRMLFVVKCPKMAFLFYWLILAIVQAKFHPVTYVLFGGIIFPIVIVQWLP